MHTRPFYTTRTFYIVMTTMFVLVLAIVFIDTTRDIRATIENTFIAETSTAQTLTVENEQYLTLKQKLKLPDVAPSADTTPIATTTPELATTTELLKETAAPAIILSDYSLAIRNGTNINGLAGVLATTLTTAGFAQAKIGNATPQTETEIYIKESIRTEVAAILKTSAPELLAEAVIVETNPTSADIVIILGAK